jgi:hypothetical protein
MLGLFSAEMTRAKLRIKNENAPFLLKNDENNDERQKIRCGYSE